MPKISVIVPVYKVEPYLHRCVDSILAQTYTDFDLILVDDGSPDSCPTICDEYAEKDSRIVVIHQKNGGLSAARNTGIDWALSNSNSEWITFVDSDDWVHCMYLEVLFTAANNNCLNISSCILKRVKGYVKDESLDLKITIETSENVYTMFGKQGLSYACGRLYKKHCFRSVRFPKGLLFEDVATMYKILLAEDRIAYVENELYYYFYNEAGIAVSNWHPQKIDILIAYEEQLYYLKKRKALKQTYRVIQKDYLQAIASQDYCIRNSITLEHKRYLRGLRWRMRKGLFQYYRSLKLKVSEDYRIFEVAFPNLMKIFWWYKTHFQEKK